MIHKTLKDAWDDVRGGVDKIGKELGRLGGSAIDAFEGLTDPFMDKATKWALRDYYSMRAKLRRYYLRDMYATGGTEFEAARKTATAVRSAKGSTLQPSGTKKFVIPREKKRKRGLTLEFSLGDQGGSKSSAVNVGGSSGITGLQI